jgi:hypothetical protein
VRSGSAIHLFLSTATGLAVFTGQQLGTFGPVTVREHVDACVLVLTPGPEADTTSS